jgi:hypothetical protein
MARKTLAQQMLDLLPADQRAALVNAPTLAEEDRRRRERADRIEALLAKARGE